MIFAGHLFCVLTPWQFFPDPDRDPEVRNGLPDPDSDADRHQNVISWSLGRGRDGNDPMGQPVMGYESTGSPF